MAETEEFKRLLNQNVILENLVLTGLRGLGKTVLLDTFKPKAIAKGWLWVGTDLSESSSISEDRIVLRLLTDLALVSASLQIGEHVRYPIGFSNQVHKTPTHLDYRALEIIYNNTPGLPSDKLKGILEIVWQVIQAKGSNKGLIFAYDEAQNLADHNAKDQYPLSLLLDVFQAIQKKGIPFMLILVGLPTLFPKLVEARTFSERMFRVVFLDKLTEAESRDAIMKPIEDAKCPVKLNEESIKLIVKLSGGYPYFIQFVCREAYDSFLQGQGKVPVAEIIRKLDTDFFAGRWARATDRQRDLLAVISQLPHAGSEFTVQEIAERAKDLLKKPFSASHISQMLVVLADNGLVYKNRHGKYSFAVPLLGEFIQRQIKPKKDK